MAKRSAGASGGRAWREWQRRRTRPTGRSAVTETSSGGLEAESQRRPRRNARRPRNRVGCGTELRTGYRRRGGFRKRMAFLLAARAGERPGQSLPSVPPQGRPPSRPDSCRDRGNHALPESRHLPVVGWYPIEVLHFPIRTVRQAKEKLVSWAQALGAQGSRRRCGTGAGQRDVNTSVASYLLDEVAIQRGLRAGVLVEDLRLRDALRSLLEFRRPDVASSSPVTIVGESGSSRAGRTCRSSATWHPTTTRRCLVSDGEWTTLRVGCRCSTQGV